LEGTIRFSPNLDYWTGNAFFIPFQTQVTFWLLGGKNVVMNGGGTLDGAGQVSFSVPIFTKHPYGLTLLITGVV
jgi:hypothetical protein